MKSLLLILLSSAGMYISLYFTLVYYSVIKSSARFMPRFCRLDQISCSVIIHHKDARVLRAPNFVIGLAYYSLILFYVGNAPMPWLDMILTYASWLTVGLGIYLVYSLYFVVKVMCPLCLISHAVNLVIAIVLSV